MAHRSGNPTWQDSPSTATLISAAALENIEGGVDGSVKQGDLVIKVKDAPYNAKGDGVTDDTSAIQAALNAVSTALGVVDVYFPDGTYMVQAVNSAKTGNQKWIGAGLLPKSGTRIILRSGATLKVIPNNSASYSLMFLADGVSDVLITGGAILGDRATHDYSDLTYPTHEFGYGIAMRGASNITVDNVHVSGLTGDAVIIAPLGNDVGVSGYIPASDITVRNCVLDLSRRNNISVIGASGVLIEDNTITNAGVNDGIHDGTAPRAGIDLEFGYHEVVQNITVRGNVFTGNVSCSVSQYNATKVVITDNFCDNSITCGAHANMDTSIVGNILNAALATTSGITISTATQDQRILISDNLIRGFLVGISSAGHGAEICGNYITGIAATGQGISLFQATDTLISNNKIVGDATSTTQTGISLAGSTGVRATANSLSGVATGILLTTTPSTGVVMQSNIITIAKVGVSTITSTGNSWILKDNTFNLAGHASGQAADVAWNADSSAVVACIGNLHKGSVIAYVGAHNGVVAPARIIGNRITSDSAYIQMTLAGGSYHIADNFIATTGSSFLTFGIGLTGTITQTVVDGNTIISYGGKTYQAGVDTSSGTGSIVTNNRTKGATISVKTAASDSISGNVMLDRLGVQAVSATVTAKLGDSINANATSAAFTVTSPALANGARFSVTKTDASANVVTVTPASGTINGAANVALSSQWAKTSWISDGTNWFLA